MAFRDYAHGFLVWAFGTIISVWLLTSAAGYVASGAAQAGTAIASSAAEGAGDAIGAVAPDATGYATDVLLRPGQPGAGGQSADPRAKIGRIVARSVAAGQISDQDRQYLTQLIAQQAGVTPEEANRRIDEAVAQGQETLRQAETTARQTADTARRAAANVAFGSFGAALLGVLISCFMAGVGGRQRDEV